MPEQIPVVFTSYRQRQSFSVFLLGSRSLLCPLSNGRISSNYVHRGVEIGVSRHVRWPAFCVGLCVGARAPVHTSGCKCSAHSTGWLTTGLIS